MKQETEDLKERIIDGKKVRYASGDAGYGVEYLESLEREEAAVFFDGAYRAYPRSIPFEDRKRWNYTMTYVSNGGGFYYLIELRSK